MQTRVIAAASVVTASCLLFASEAEAQARVTLEVRPPGIVTSGSDLIEYSDSLSVGSGTATGFANLQTGVLQSRAIGPTGPTASSAFSSAESRFSDSFTFQGSPLSGVAQLDWSFNGEITSGSSPEVSFAQLAIFVNGEAEFHLFFDSNVCAFALSATTCSWGTEIQLAGTFPINVSSSINSITVALQATAYGGEEVNFSNSANFYLRLPSGISINSESGVFLQLAPPIPGIPEPSTLALLSFGIIGFSLLRKRRRDA
jgi:hypothetical protein